MMSAQEANTTLYAVTCGACYHVIIISGGEAIMAYGGGYKECEACETVPSFYHIKVQGFVEQKDWNHQVDMFFWQWEKWLETEEGRLAQEKARYNL